MATKKTATATKTEISVEDKLRALYELQQIDSLIDKIKIVRGELPMEVSDLEDEIVGLETRTQKFTEEAGELEEMVVKKKQEIKDSQAAIKKYEAQQMNVKNNREYDSLTKEIEFQNLEIQLSEKKIKEFSAQLAAKNEMITSAKESLNDRQKDLDLKKSELESIVSETQKEEEALMKKSQKAAEIIEERLVTAYRRIRENARNCLAVVSINRDACGGCFNKIPPQRQIDIKQHKKIIVCEHCGRILVDAVSMGLIEA